ncbi:MAG: hydantoinase B/oxoprolinase family protein [Pseudomonadota bacterium]
MTDRQTTPGNAVQMEIFSHRLLAITEEMGEHLVRSSFSPNIKERRDCSVALFDAAGRVVVQAAHIPIHLGSLLGGVEAVLNFYAVEDMCPGDAFVCNDAYLAGGTHLPDIAIITPVFIGGRVEFFAANLGHHADVGGPVPGSISPTAPNIFAEGLRIPPARLQRAGELDEGLLRLIAHNTREPDERILDLKVQLAVNTRGAVQVEQLAARLGMANMREAMADLLSYTARRLRLHIEALPDGTHEYTTWMDHDGTGGARLPITATVTVDGDRLHLDFTGTGPQSRGGYNVMPSGVLATIAYALKALLDPELPPNSGLFDAVHLTVPAGTILNPHFPAAVGARTTTCQKLAGAIFGAFRAFLPGDRAMADSHDVLAAMVFSGRRRSGSGNYVYLETIGGGNGALANADGMDGAHVHITNSLNMPVEAVELEYPLHVEEYALIPDSGGDGTWRGGLGIAREVRILDDETTFGARADSFETCAEGALGGRTGSNARVVVNGGTAAERILEPRHSALPVVAGDRVRMETPGGAGFGEPSARDPVARQRDIDDGKVTAGPA